jgi:alpha-beta hydrolase superfamily lysophospholipase
MIEREIDGPGGLPLFVRCAWPEGRGDGEGAGAPRGLLAVVPGFSDHSGRYEHLFREGTRAGYVVASLDTRGHGRSGGTRGHVESFDEYLLDVDRFLSHARREWADGAPLFAWGHSMGALILIAYLSAGFGRGAGLRAAVACAPPFRIAAPVPRWKSALARGMSRLAPSVPFASPLDPADLSRDLAIGERYMKDPLVHQVCSPRLFTELLGTASRIFSNPFDYGVPTLFIHGGDDRICDITGTRGYYERSPLVRKDFRSYAGARHEVHNDPAHADAFRDAFAFYDSCAPVRSAEPAPAPVGAGAAGAGARGSRAGSP